MPHSKTNWFLYTVLAFIFLKFLLISHYEVTGSNFDEANYVLGVNQGYYGGNATAQWVFIRPPGFVLWSSLVKPFGIPYRIAIEMLYAFSLYVFVGSLRHFRIPLGICLFLFFGMWMHPWTLSAFNTFLSEPFYLCLNILLLGLVIRMIKEEGIPWRLCLSVLGITTLMLATRRETPLILSYFGLFIFMGLFYRLRTGKSVFSRKLLWEECRKYGGVLLGAFLLIQIVNGLNYWKWGMWVTSEQQAPGFVRLLDVLYKIDTPDAMHYAPVTRKTLEMAMEVSPEFRKLKASLLSKDNSHARFGKLLTGKEGELGPWLWWRLYAGLSEQGIYTSPKAASDWMLKAADEIDNAMDRGELPAKFLSLPFPLDVNVGNWIASIPLHTWESIKRAFVSHYYRSNQDVESRLKQKNKFAFDEALNRRESLFRNNRIRVEGLAFCKEGEIDCILLCDDEGRSLGSAIPQDYASGMNKIISKVMGQASASGAPVSQSFNNSKGDIIEEIVDNDKAIRVAFALEANRSYKAELFLKFIKSGRVLHEERVYPGRRSFGHLPVNDDDNADFAYWISDFFNPVWETKTLIKVRGWGYTKDGGFQLVNFTDGNGHIFGDYHFYYRGDIDSMYQGHYGVPEKSQTLYGFDLTTMIDPGKDIPLMEVWQHNKKLGEFDLNEWKAPTWDDQVPTLDEEGTWTYGIAKVETLPPRSARVRFVDHKEDFIKHFKAYYFYYYVALGIIVLGLALGFRKFTPAGISVEILGLLFGFVSFRVLFYALIEAVVVPDQERYIACIQPITISLSFLLLSALIVYISPILTNYLRKVRKSS